MELGPDTPVDWMWAGAHVPLTGAVGRSLARANPFRWGGGTAAKTLVALRDESTKLDTALDDALPADARTKRVLVRVQGSGGKEQHEFDGAALAANWIEEHLSAAAGELSAAELEMAAHPSTAAEEGVPPQLRPQSGHGMLLQLPSPPCTMTTAPELEAAEPPRGAAAGRLATLRGAAVDEKVLIRRVLGVGDASDAVGLEVEVWKPGGGAGAAAGSEAGCWCFGKVVRLQGDGQAEVTYTVRADASNQRPAHQGTQLFDITESHRFRLRAERLARISIDGWIRSASGAARADEDEDEDVFDTAASMHRGVSTHSRPAKPGQPSVQEGSTVRWSVGVGGSASSAAPLPAETTPRTVRAHTYDGPLTHCHCHTVASLILHAVLSGGKWHR